MIRASNLEFLIRMGILATPSSLSRDSPHRPEVYTMPPSRVGLREVSWPLFREMKVGSMETTN